MKDILVFSIEKEELSWDIEVKIDKFYAEHLLKFDSFYFDIHDESQIPTWMHESFNNEIKLNDGRKLVTWQLLLRYSWKIVRKDLEIPSGKIIIFADAY